VVYYNEIDEAKAEWLKELIKEGVIADGLVDRRSIRDVSPGDLDGFIQCHFFAGVGIWSYALTLAGWPADRAVWTGSCPCGPFSSAGKRAAQNDPRHLWPDFFRLIEARRPVCVLGEQVSSIDGLGWLDLVLADLDSAAYTLGALDICAAGVGAPHIRQRLYWGARLAHAHQRGCQPVEPVEHGGADSAHKLEFDLPRANGPSGGLEHAEGDGRIERRAESGQRGPVGGCGDVRLGDSDDARLDQRGQRDMLPLEPGLAAPRRLDADRPIEVGGLGHSESLGWGRRQDDDDQGRGQLPFTDRGPFNGFWRGAHWVLTRPQRLGDVPSLRPIEPRPLPLADGNPGDLVRVRHPGFPLAQGEEARVLRLRGYGDAICASQAAFFVKAFMEELEEE